MEYLSAKFMRRRYRNFEPKKDSETKISVAEPAPAPVEQSESAAPPPEPVLAQPVEEKKVSMEQIMERLAKLEHGAAPKQIEKKEVPVEQPAPQKKALKTFGFKDDGLF